MVGLLGLLGLLPIEVTGLLGGLQHQLLGYWGLFGFQGGYWITGGLLRLLGLLGCWGCCGVTVVTAVLGLLGY